MTRKLAIASVVLFADWLLNLHRTGARASASNIPIAMSILVLGCTLALTFPNLPRKARLWIAGGILLVWTILTQVIWRHVNLHTLGIWGGPFTFTGLALLVVLINLLFYLLIIWSVDWLVGRAIAGFKHESVAS